MKSGQASSDKHLPSRSVSTSVVPSREVLDTIYRKYTRREYVHPDPIEFLYRYDDPRDQELVALVASSMAYGNVRQILNSIEWILQRMKPSPTAFLYDADRAVLQATLGMFKHRWSTGKELVNLLGGAQYALRRHGSLYKSFLCGLGSRDKTLLRALSFFVRELKGTAHTRNSLIPSPEQGSACKRWHLFLRWLVRKDPVDPGGWTGIPASKLVVPVDTHMHRLGRVLKFTERNQADERTAMEITEGFSQIAPEDPVRYDFALTRLGIWGEEGFRTMLTRKSLSVAHLDDVLAMY